VAVASAKSGPGAVVAAVIRRPDLWLTGLRQWRHMTPRSWWRRAPFLPVPTRDYRRFRAITQYGDADHPMVGDDVVSWLEWCREHRQITGRRSHQR
jgi:hypothetical protein